MNALTIRRTLFIGALAIALTVAATLVGCAVNDPLGQTELQAIGSSSADETSSYCAPLPSDPLPESERYRGLTEPGFVATSDNACSTLSADVDTASYCNLRRMAADGYAPIDVPADAVRTEELLNYFDYGYPTPDDGDMFGISAQVGDCPWNDETKLLVMGFATEPADYAASTGSNLVFLIDTSGSMDEPDKLPLLKGAFATLVEGLDEHDRVSIVTYASGEHVVLEGASGSDKQRILHAVESLTAAGATNGEAGLERAYDMAERSFIEGGVNRIVMASDGDLNVGISSTEELHRYVERKRESGVYLSVLGFGSASYQDAKMETLADHGNGVYHYIDCVEEAKRVLCKNLRANLAPLADDVKVQVVFDPAQIESYRLIGYENRRLASEDFRDDCADAGEVGAGHSFTVAYEIIPAEAADGAWLTCAMRYRPSGSSEHAEQSFVLDASSYDAQPGEDWILAASVIECSMALQRSPFVGTASFESARELLSDIALDDERRGLYDLLVAFAERDAATRRFEPVR